MQHKTVRRIDELGRIVLPQEYRNALAWGEETEVAIIKEGNRLILQANSGSCFLCGSEENLCLAKDRFICKDCISEIAVSQ